MIIWINGAFGAGKSLVAEELRKRLKDSFVYDPEQVGYFLWNNFPDDLKRKGDFQDIALWRSFNYQILKYLSENYAGVLIVPMTIHNKAYFDALIGGLRNDQIDVRHVILMAEKKTIVNRLHSRGGDTAWAEAQIDKCLAAFHNSITGVTIHTDMKTPQDIVSEILSKCNIPLSLSP